MRKAVPSAMAEELESCDITINNINEEKNYDWKENVAGDGRNPVAMGGGS